MQYSVVTVDQGCSTEMVKTATACRLVMACTVLYYCPIRARLPEPEDDDDGIHNRMMLSMLVITTCWGFISDKISSDT